ncbi:hypothetical protein OIU79_019936 [Salix purpurea]|uniref:Uncharacterized protein n=1 Tax=Salix purpurea TaxID=77065 RepID=A0A9Q0P2E4_SALPP|nr:hypothetical protein OIU79_019936 [Salix purpurea]
MDGSRQDEDNLQVSNTLISPKVDKDGKVDLESRSDNKLGSFESSHVCAQDSSGEGAGDGKVDLESQLCRNTTRTFALFRGIAYTNTRNLEDKVPHESEGSGICFARVSTVIGRDVLRNNCHVHTFLSQGLSVKHWRFIC